VGSGDRATFWALHHLSADRDTVLTVHDPRVFVNQLFDLPYSSSGPPVLHDIAFHAARALDLLVGRQLYRRVLRRARSRIVLNRLVRQLWGFELEYLPQPLYSARPLPHAITSPACIAFAGYWGPAKGLDDLLAAYEDLLPRFPDARFMIAGGGVRPDDHWAAAFRARASATSNRIEMPGFIAPSRLDDFLAGLTALVLPYRNELPGAASAMLMRAQQAGVPLIISDTPFLRAQVEPESVTIVPPLDPGALVAAIAAHLDEPASFVARAAKEQARIHAAHGDARVAARLRQILGPSRA
jgi:glycosyltransferase involved in cell wall biosynthesis